MNYTSPLILSVFIHLGIGLSFSNFFNIDFDIFNIESAKPISAYVIFEKETEPKKEQIKIPKKTKSAEPVKNDIKTIAISSPDLVIDKLQQLSSTEAYLPEKRRNKFSQSDIEKYSFLIKQQVFNNWKRPKGSNPELKTEIQINLVPTGEILSAKIIKGSGNQVFDDSALVAILAVDALGPEAVRCLMLPSGYTADISKADADDMAGRLGIQIDTVPIGKGMRAVDDMMAPLFEGREADVTEENIQSRLRGLLLMALSNKYGDMILTTGNKSEYAAGYATLYGDMCGGFAPLKDVWKTLVFELAKWRNTAMPRGALGPEGEVTPPRIITRPPSAELRPDQEDTDSLPPYDVLDAILKALTEEMASPDEIVAQGYDRDVVERVSKLLFRAEYKRFQSAPGPKITTRAFGRERRLPLTSGFLPASSE